MDLIHALRLASPRPSNPAISFVGSGGKTTALFQLAQQLLSNNKLVLATATSHLGIWQTSYADSHSFENELQNIPDSGVALITGLIENDRTQPVEDNTLNRLREKSKSGITPLLIESDGARQKHLKAPNINEPPIPDFADIVIHVVGISAVGKPLNDENVHQAEIFSDLTGLKIGGAITSDSLIKYLTHPKGGQKNIPAGAQKILMLNQAETAELQSLAGHMAKQLLDHFDSVVVGSLENQTFRTFEHTAGIILAAGEATRYGSPKQLLDWNGKPFVRHIAETAAQAGLWPIVVVTGSRAAEVESALEGLPVNIAHNADYKLGQSTSIKTGINFIQHSSNKHIGSAIFLLADQPQIPSDVMQTLVELHSKELHPIIVPLVLEERRANPVLFDRAAFNDLLHIEGDVGGRAIFDKHRVEFLPWHDDILLLDVDKPEDYQRLLQIDNP